MTEMELVRDGKNRYRLVRTGKMRVDAVVYVNEVLLPLLRDDKSLEQLAHAAMLPGVINPVVGMPDIHEGFGLPIGGVMAVGEDGVISAGAVGMDINCGVRLIRTDLRVREVPVPQLKNLMLTVEDYVPTGVGKKSKHGELSRRLFERVARTGVRALVEQGVGAAADLEYIEEGGCLAGADLDAVSREAYKRGETQLGTLGGGNHFIEFQEVAELLEPALAERWGLFPGQLTVMIHTGSRGFGHQICTDFSRSHVTAAKKYGIELPNKGLACAPSNSPEGRQYFQAMACAVNFAFANRHLISHDVGRAFADVFRKEPEKLGFGLVYDVAHNIAKWERHGGRKVLVHRKGATRALPPGHEDNPRPYRETGHPALIPGSMGTSSYVLAGTERAAATFFSVNHGAGRVLSRGAAERTISREQFEESMGAVLYNIRNFKEIVDESPLAYKDVDQVVQTLAEIGLTRKVARLRPLAVIKGKD
ncbi:RNA-2',3'-PO4:RNA-5'-OH ligase [Candidatus Desulforudis audaxviator]|nr:RNA-2',3'-PO4:RNA-5'-OH ligase [Candidatus Desulforudis audaxviator]